MVPIHRELDHIRRLLEDESTAPPPRRRAGGLPQSEDWIEDVLVGLPTMLSLSEAADALGVSEKTVRRMLARREIDVSVDLSQRGAGQAALVRVPRLALAAMLRRLRK